jgi:hypothetical protein
MDAVWFFRPMWIYSQTDLRKPWGDPCDHGCQGHERSEFHNIFWALMPIYESHASAEDAIDEVIRLFMLLHPASNAGFDYKAYNYKINITGEHHAHYTHWCKASASTDPNNHMF